MFAKFRTLLSTPYITQEYVARSSSLSVGKYLMAGRTAPNCALTITELQRLSRSYVVCLGDMHMLFSTSKQVLFVPLNFQTKCIYGYIFFYCIFFIKSKPLSDS